MVWDWLYLYEHDRTWDIYNERVYLRNKPEPLGLMKRNYKVGNFGGIKLKMLYFIQAKWPQTLKANQVSVEGPGFLVCRNTYKINKCRNFALYFKCLTLLFKILCSTYYRGCFLNSTTQWLLFCHQCTAFLIFLLHYFPVCWIHIKVCWLCKKKKKSPSCKVLCSLAKSELPPSTTDTVKYILLAHRFLISF